MTEHQGLQVSGYQPQTSEKVDIVNGFKADEERILRRIDEISSQTFNWKNADGTLGGPDMRWLAIGRTQLEQAFMAINRSVFRPTRVKLVGDSDD